MFNFKKRKLEKKRNKEIKLHDKSYVNPPIKLDRKKFNYKIRYDNGELEEGECTVDYIDDLAEMFLKNKYTLCNNNKKMIFYNSDRIMTFEAIEKEKGEE